MKKIALFLAVAVVGGFACADQGALRDMELRLESGVVNVIRDGETINVEDTIGLRPGDVIVSKEDALAEFALEGGADARQGKIQGNSRLLVRSTTSVEAQEGNVLMRVSESTKVLVDGVTASASESVFRIDRRLGSVRAGAYTGSVLLDAPGQTDMRLPRLHQATIVAGDLPNQTRPYQLDLKDPWDEVVLEKVVELEQTLVALSRGFTGQIGRQRPGIAYFRALAGNENVDFIRRYLSRKPSDLLIGFTIARNADTGLRPTFQDAFELFDAGARWGIAAAILEVEPRPIVAQLEELILGTGAVAASGGGNARFDLAAASAGASGDASSATSSTTTGSSTGTTTGTGSTDTTDSQDPKEEPKKPPKEPDECTDGAQCTIEELEDELFPDEEPSPSPTNQSLLGD